MLHYFSFCLRVFHSSLYGVNNNTLTLTLTCFDTRAITSVVYGRNAENEPVSRIKMADYSELVSMGTL